MDELYSATRFDDLSQNQVVQPKGSIRLIQVSRWRLATRFDDLSQKQVMQPGNQFNSGKSADEAQQFTLTSPTAHFEDLTILPWPRSPKARPAWAGQPTQPQRLNLKSLAVQFMHIIQIIQFVKKRKNTPVRTQKKKKK